jgi:plasmid stabilization system protein ParE
MSLPAVYLPEAMDDIDAGFAHFEQTLVGLGDRFLEALRQSVDQVIAMPELFGAVDRDIRAVSLRRFPYLLFYRVEKDRILIVAVQHGRRSWSAWQDRT